MDLNPKECSMKVYIKTNKVDNVYVPKLVVLSHVKFCQVCYLCPAKVTRFVQIVSGLEL